MIYIISVILAIMIFNSLFIELAERVRILNKATNPMVGHYKPEVDRALYVLGIGTAPVFFIVSLGLIVYFGVRLLVRKVVRKSRIVKRIKEIKPLDLVAQKIYQISSGSDK